MSPAWAMASRQAATAIPRVMRPEMREYSVRPIPTTAQTICLSDLLRCRVTRQAQNALGDQVSHNFRRAARDRQAPAEQIVVYDIGFLSDQDGPVGDSQRQFCHPLSVLGTEQFGDVAFDSGPGVEDGSGGLPQ